MRIRNLNFVKSSLKKGDNETYKIKRNNPGKARLTASEMTLLIVYKCLIIVKRVGIQN